MSRVRNKPREMLEFLRLLDAELVAPITVRCTTLRS